MTDRIPTSKTVIDGHLDSLQLLVGADPPIRQFDFSQPATRLRRMGTGTAAPKGGIPQSIDDLGSLQVQSYDLSVTAAGNLNFPVAGSLSGGYSRRLVVLEQTAYREIKEGDAILRYGYAVRFCVTVTKWDASLKLSLPFLAASAEVGNISAHWALQVNGLTGRKIDEALTPPTELNVEKFVLAKQSLEKLVAAIRDETTKFEAAVLSRVGPAELRTRQQRIAVAQAYALSSIDRGRSLADAIRRLDADPSANSLRADSVRDVYRAFGLEDDITRPPDDVRRQAREIMDGVRADI